MVRVRDTSIGIAKEDITDALTLFGQVNSVLSRKLRVTGLGLPLSRSLAQLHGGALTLESEPDIATCDVIALLAERITQD